MAYAASGAPLMHAPMPRGTRVCLVIGHTETRARITTDLIEQGFAVSAFGDAASFYRAVAGGGHELVVIDAGLEGESGLSIALHLRSNPKIGIVVLLTSSTVEARLRGFESGADACLVDPVDMRELVAQLRVVHRRLSRQGSADATRVSDDWSIAKGGWALRDPAGNELPLTTAERTFIRRLSERPGETVSRAELITCLGGDPVEADPHRIDVLVNRMRHKASLLNVMLPVQSVRGKGYVMTAASDAKALDLAPATQRMVQRPLRRSHRAASVLVRRSEETG